MNYCDFFKPKSIVNLQDRDELLRFYQRTIACIYTCTSRRHFGWSDPSDWIARRAAINRRDYTANNIWRFRRIGGPAGALFVLYVGESG